MAAVNTMLARPFTTQDAALITNKEGQAAFPLAVCNMPLSLFDCPCFLERVAGVEPATFSLEG